MTAGITAAEILHHPCFVDARTAHIDAVVGLFEKDRFAGRMMNDAGVIIFRGFLVGLHLAFDADDPATWATPGNLKRGLFSRGIASPRRTDALIARFLQAGYATVARSPRDRRTRILTPTASLIAHDLDHLAAYHRFLLDLFPGHGYEWVLSRDGQVHRRIRAAALAALPRALSALTHEAMGLFLMHDAGYLAFLLVARAQLAGRDGPTWTALSDSLGVSRSHLRGLFGEAARAGYVRLITDARRAVEVLPPLWDAYNAFLADVGADQHAIAQAAFAGRA